MSYSATRWILFVALAAFLPLLYFMFVVGGLLPFAEILLITLSDFQIGFLIFNGIQVVLYGVILFALAGWLARRINNIAARYRVATMALTLACLAAIGALPIYGVGHSATSGTSSVYSRYWHHLVPPNNSLERGRGR